MAAEQGTPGDRLIRILAEHPAEVRGLAFRPDGRHVVSACLDGTVKVWDVATGREVSSFHHHLRNPARAWFSPDARLLAWTCQDSDINVWDTATRGEGFAPQTHTHRRRALAFSTDDPRLA